MVGFAEVTVSGIVVTDPELVETSTGPVTRFTVATNAHRFEAVTGQPMDPAAIFLTCTIRWRQAAQNVAASLIRGTHVLVTGVLQQRAWNTTEGHQRYAYEVAATEVGISLNFAAVSITTAFDTPHRQDGD
jgi:single-strand DNA-binding protein